MFGWICVCVYCRVNGHLWIRIELHWAMCWLNSLAPNHKWSDHGTDKQNQTKLNIVLITNTRYKQTRNQFLPPSPDTFSNLHLLKVHNTWMSDSNWSEKHEHTHNNEFCRPFWDVFKNWTFRLYNCIDWND